jgi:hypothetical protein
LREASTKRKKNINSLLCTFTKNAANMLEQSDEKKKQTLKKLFFFSLVLFLSVRLY